MSTELEHWLELIPLYINGSLQEDQRRAFENALQTSPELQAELALMRDVQSSWEHRENEADFDALFNRIQPTLDKQESVVYRRKQPSIFQRISAWLAVPQLAWGMVAAQFCVIAILIGVSVNEKNDIGYRTLTGDNYTQSQVAVNVVFVEHATLQQINTLLHSVNARIVDGPTAAGRVTLELIDKRDESRSTDERIAMLRESEIVTLAEPGS